MVRQDARDRLRTALFKHRCRPFSHGTSGPRTLRQRPFRHTPDPPLRDRPCVSGASTVDPFSP